MITSINEFRKINENLSFNINDVKQQLPEYQEILNLGYSDNTSDIQAKRGNLNFISNSSSVKYPMFKLDNYPTVFGPPNKKFKGRDSQLEYTIYANGKLRMNAPGSLVKAQHITFDLQREINSIEDCKLLLQKLIKSAKRAKFNESKINENSNEELDWNKIENDFNEFASTYSKEEYPVMRQTFNFLKDKLQK